MDEERSEKRCEMTTTPIIARHGEIQPAVQLRMVDVRRANNAIYIVQTWANLKCVCVQFCVHTKRTSRNSQSPANATRIQSAAVSMQYISCESSDGTA